MSDSEFRVVLCTFPSARQAGEVAKTLVSERLAACVNVSEVTSIYTWNDELHDEPEALAIIKTSAKCFEALAQRINELHPYEVPEIIALPIAAGHAPYLAWLAGNTR